MPSLKNHLIDIIDHSPMIRKILLNTGLSVFTYAMLSRFDCVGGMKIKPDGELVEYLFGERGRIKFVTGINQNHNMIVLSSSNNNVLAVVNAA